MAANTPGHLGKPGTEDVKAKLIQETHFPAKVKVGYNDRDQDVFELDVLRALQTHEIFFCVDDASNILSRNFALRIGQVMASINPDKVNQETNESAFYSRFRNVIFLVYTANEFLQLHVTNDNFAESSKSKIDFLSASKHRTCSSGYAVYWLKWSPELATAFQGWTDNFPPYDDFRFLTLTRLNQHVFPERNGKSGKINIEVLTSAIFGTNEQNIEFLLGKVLRDHLLNMSSLFVGFLSMQLSLKLQVEKLARICKNFFFRSLDAATMPEQAVVSTNHSIFSIPDSTMIDLLGNFLFANDIFSLRMFGTTCKLYKKLISIDVCRRICKIPMLATVGNSQEHLDRTVTTIQSFIEAQKENTFLGCRESSTSLVTAITSLDRVVALFGGYHCEIVARLIKEKKAANEFYLKASSPTDFAKAEVCYTNIYHNLYKDFGVLISNMPCKKANLKGEELHCPGYKSVPPVCKGTKEVQTLLCQVLSNAGQCCIKQRNKINMARKFLHCALSYLPNHTKSLWRLGVLEMQDDNYQKSKEWFYVAKQSTTSSQLIKI